ncbi:MAG: copper-binding protein [Alphaproteobacteria bacterium]|nr:copper-binding protein [Alphaproteobacteria bacterium]
MRFGMLTVGVSTALLTLAAAAAADPRPGHGHHGHGHHATSVGEPGKPSAARRTVEVTLGDNFFEPERITVRAGETVRFVVRNAGELLHEFNIATPEDHRARQLEMAMMVEHGMITATAIDHEKMKMDHKAMGMPDMKHDHANSVLVEPGKTAALIWRFTRATTIQFACNIPGHYEAGMVGRFEFER